MQVPRYVYTRKINPCISITILYNTTIDHLIDRDCVSAAADKTDIESYIETI